MKRLILKYIKNTLYYLLAQARVIYLFRWLDVKLYGNRVIILYTHRIISRAHPLRRYLKALGYLDYEEFEKKVRYLKQNYTFITLTQAIEHLRQGSIPKNCMVLTFDDGYACNYKEAFPVLMKHKIPAVIFIAAGAMDGKTVFWYDKVISAIGITKRRVLSFPEISGKKYKLETLRDRKNAAQEICRLLKQVENRKKEQMVDSIMASLGVDNDLIRECNLMLTWDEVGKMVSSGRVEIGAHTISHPILTNITLEEAGDEIRGSKEFIEKNIGRRVKFFCYPNGDYNGEIESIVKSCGFEAAFTTDESARNKDLKVFSLGRCGLTREEFYFFAAKISGMIDLIKNLFSEINKVKPWAKYYYMDKIQKAFNMGAEAPAHIFVCVCDHFEPLWQNKDAQKGLQRVKNWYDKYPGISDRYRDADGCAPKYTFFYPAEEYRPEYMALLAEFCERGYGEVEIHLHHDNDTADNLNRVLIEFRDVLAKRYNLLSIDKQTAEVKYGFIHGNWSLDNSNPSGRWCGVNNEIGILEKTGCYADFTMPSAPHVTQTKKVNSIYYAVDNPSKPKSHDKGKDARRGQTPAKGLLMVQGPLAFNWHSRKWRLIPRIENGSIGGVDKITPERVKIWVETKIAVKGREDCVFIKLYTHGCQEKNMDYLLGGGLDKLYSYFQVYCDSNKKYALHYVSAREMVNVIKAVEDDVPLDDFNHLRNYRFARAAKE